VRESVGREFHDAGPEKEKARSPNLVRTAQPRCDVAGRLRERTQAGAGHSGGGRLHNIGHNVETFQLECCASGCKVCK